MRGKQIAIGLILTLSVVLLCYSLYIGVMIGADWYGKDSEFQWHMNNYIVMDAKYAYSIFGLATMAIGGLATGLAMAAFFIVTKTKKHILMLVTAFFVAIAMSGLGFNTLDFMLGSFYWTNMTYPPPVQVPVFGAVDVWNFYFFFFVVPLWFSGFLMGSAASYYAYVVQPKQAATAYVANKNFGKMIAQASLHKDYLAESKAFSVTRKIIKENFDNIN
ncbi:MAG: hypothetical protein M1540_06790 [Candidatus Bathyarchaeota archaeon]|nr:hypothetical protein [Candidatus Bathyarchaeota archaeon]